MFEGSLVLPLMLGVALIALASFARAAAGTWLNPAALFPMWWCLAGIVPLVMASAEPVSPAAMLWVLVASVCVTAGAIVGNLGLKTKLRIPANGAALLEVRILTAAMLISIVLGMGSNLAHAVLSGVSTADLFDLEKLVVVSNQLYVIRYAEGNAAPEPPRLAQALLPFVYLAPAFGGLVFAFTRSRLTKSAAILSLLPAVAVTILQTTKAAVLFSSTLWFCSYFTARVRMGRLGLFTKGHMLVAGLLAGIAVVFFFAIGLARLGTTDVGMIDVVFLKLVTAAFGHMSVFSTWLAEYWQDPFEPKLGVYTFAGPRELLGIARRVPGVFENVVELVAGESSNVFTGFRPLIEDFGMIGALIILTVLGFAAGVGFRNVAKGNWGGAPVLIAAYMTIIWTPITWFWIYNSLTATVVATAAFIWIIRTWRRGRSHSVRVRGPSPTRQPGFDPI
jgi:oligosaccharide repeat unit polymerase